MDPAIVAKAQRGNANALSMVVQACYPSAVRIARGLCGRADLTRKTIRHTLRRSVRISSRWRDEGAPERWFLHQTVLTARAASHKAKEYGKDFLFGANEETPYIAFVRAIRALPRQQAEAYLLRTGEKLDERACSVAMDLSTQATKVHFDAAEAFLKKLAGENYERFVAMLQHSWAVDPPAAEDIASVVNYTVAKYVWPRRIWAIIRFIILLAVLGTVTFLVWNFWGKVDI